MNLQSQQLVQQIDIEIKTHDLLTALKAWDKKYPEIFYDYRISNGEISLIFFDRFVLIREYEDGSYRAAAIGMNEDEDQGDVLFSQNLWFLVDFRVLRNNDLAMEIINELNNNLKTHKMIKHVHNEFLDRDEIVNFIPKMWNVFSESRYATVH